LIILLTVLFFVLTVISLVKHDDDFVSITGGLFLVFLIVAILLGVSVKNGALLDTKIAMYQEENKNIENDMDILIEKYMNYEANTYEDLKGESSITLVALYPDLKANILVEKQIEVYTENNKKIREFKESKINLPTKKWWLYFGK